MKMGHFLFTLCVGVVSVSLVAGLDEPNIRIEEQQRNAAGLDQNPNTADMNEERARLEAYKAAKIAIRKTEKVMQKKDLDMGSMIKLRSEVRELVKATNKDLDVKSMEELLTKVRELVKATNKDLDLKSMEELLIEVRELVKAMDRDLEVKSLEEPVTEVRELVKTTYNEGEDSLYNIDTKDSIDWLFERVLATCDCDHQHPLGGCSISRAAPSGFACKCRYVGWFSCAGLVVQCRDSKNQYCSTPDKTVNSCLQGGGNCEGYKGCDCTFKPGGCTISRAPPANTACKCTYKGFWTCSGDVTNCKDKSSAYCTKPDTTIHSCNLGDGDCDGYTTAKCDCSYQPGGCTVSQTPPKKTACRCSYKGGWTCDGEVTMCLDFNSQYCKTPDRSVQSCIQGNGDCAGYQTGTCDCSFSNSYSKGYYTNGCAISRAPPRNTACRCKYLGWWTCGGSITRCPNVNSEYCQNPDKSKSTCVFGGGNCGGYGIF